MITLKAKFVLAGYKLLIKCPDCLISAAVSGQRGWAGICLAGAVIGAYDIWSVDMMAMLSFHKTFLAIGNWRAEEKSRR